jgi:hypothetical protein
MKKSILRAMIEIGFIIFLFYSNLQGWGGKGVWLGLSPMSLRPPILESARQPRLSVTYSLNFFESDSSRVRLH